MAYLVPVNREGDMDLEAERTQAFILIGGKETGAAGVTGRWFQININGGLGSKYGRLFVTV